MERFRDRKDAGLVLAKHLQAYAGRTDLLILGLPRGGVPVAAEVAGELDAPLDVMLVRKLGVPSHPELAMGAIASGGVRVINEDVVRQISITEDSIAAVAADEQRELERREQMYRGDRPDLVLSGRTVILVDDGIATGASMRAAVLGAIAQDPAQVVVAVPVAAAETCHRLAEAADEVVCARTPDPFRAVGLWYETFDQVTDEQVRAILADAAKAAGGAMMNRSPETVEVTAGDAVLYAHLRVPEPARGLVIFAHGSGSSRHSPRNNHVAERLHDAGLATLLMDLLTEEEETVDRVTREHRFDIGLLAGRLADAAGWAADDHRVGDLAMGMFGASTGAAAALVAAARAPDRVRAVVSRGGRPDLAGDALDEVRTPTLLIVGGQDRAVMPLNEQARVRLAGPAEIAVVPGATHLFEEPGALDRVAELARDWLLEHLA